MIFGEEVDDDDDDDDEQIAAGGNMTAIRFPALGRDGMSPHIMRYVCTEVCGFLLVVVVVVVVVVNY